jgi:DNA-binding MarR family transcriptional regulator
MGDLPKGGGELKRINAAILQFLLDGAKGRNQVAADVSRMLGIPLSPAALLVMERLGTESMRVNDLGMSVGITSGGITRQVQDLEEKGLIERSPDHNDRRAAIVKLTGKGLDAVRLADGVRGFSTRWALREWPDADVERVASVLERLAEGLRQGIVSQGVFDRIQRGQEASVDEWIRLMEAG